MNVQKLPRDNGKGRQEHEDTEVPILSTKKEELKGELVQYTSRRHRIPLLVESHYSPIYFQKTENPDAITS